MLFLFHFHFRIQIANIKKPPVWRQLAVPAHFSFAKFHLVIQAAFGWSNCHLYLFSPEGLTSSPWIKPPDEEDENEPARMINASQKKLVDIFPAHQKYTYTYDFGDGWLHKIKLEKIADGNQKNAALLDGKGACPPEDCGGPWGYENLKQILADPAHPEHNEMREWLGLEPEEDWSPETFNAEETRIAVREV